MLDRTDLNVIAKIRGDRYLLKQALYPDADNLTPEQQARLDDRLNRTVHAELPARQRDLLCAWDDQLQLDGRAISTRKTYLQKTGRFLRTGAGEQITDIGKREVNAFLADYAESTRNTYKIALKQFFLWLYMDHQGRHKEEVPRFVFNQFKTSGGTPTVEKEDIPTQEEVKQLMSAAHTFRDRAVIALLADTGMRLRELRYLKRKDVEFDRAGIALLTPTAKQGVQNPRKAMRRNRLTFARPPVQQWYENHPRDDPDAPLFCQLRKPHADLTERALQVMFHRLLEAAELPADRQDRLSLHKFRHFSITEDRKKDFMRDSYVAKKHGHVDTTMLRRYDHLTSDDVDKVQIKAMVDRGELPPEALTEVDNGDAGDHDLTLITCPNCGHGAAPDKALCPRCNQALDVDAAEEIERAMEGVRNYLRTTGKLDKIREAIHSDAQQD